MVLFMKTIVFKHKISWLYIAITIFLGMPVIPNWNQTVNIRDTIPTGIGKAMVWNPDETWQSYTTFSVMTMLVTPVSNDDASYTQWLLIRV